MAACAALTSLKYIIHNLQHHPSPPISIDQQQFRSLTEVVSFLQEFLRGYNSSFAYSEEADPLETRIADAAYKAEDVIESEIVDRIRSQSEIRNDFHQDLQLVIEEMYLIKKETTMIQANKTAVRPQLQRNVSISVGSSSTPSSAMIGFDDEFNQVLENLLGSRRNLLIIPIIGMGGIGKTTLARHLFKNARVEEHFDIRAWTTISQDYNAQQALKELLSQAKGNSSGESADELGLELYQYLLGRRYFIVLDDMWNIELWDKIRRYFPDYKDGSRVIVTTRLSNLASHFNHGLDMKFLDEVSSWKLFSRTVFCKQSFPLKLEEIGKKIVRSCRGLPLSIVTIGGLLARSKQTREYWEHIKKNLSSAVNLEANEYCLRILKMSYNHLPVHLKPCFLYMGVFKEDCIIRVSTLIKLWISEGFLEPASDKSLETMAKENLKELVDRNLILIYNLGSTGNMKWCKVHDLLRDLCIREAEQERFYHVIRNHISQGINNMRRIVMHGSTSEELVVEALQYIPHARSIICDYHAKDLKCPIPLNFRLLRTLEAFGLGSSKKIWFESVNLRFLFVKGVDEFPFSSSVDLLWNLHTLILFCYRYVTAPPEIWKMPQLRHVKFVGVMPDPPTGHVVIMENLQTLKTILNFKLNEEVVKRIPNVKKLGLVYKEKEPNEDYYCLNYLECLHRLESFKCDCIYLYVHDFLKKLTFPKSLKKLSLTCNDEFELEEMLEKIGSLPLLQMFELIGGIFRTRKWVTVEGQFPKLEFLKLQRCPGLEHWTSESSHFPLLKEIHLHNLSELREIPSEIGDISTLQFIRLFVCNKSAVMSLKKIVDEQEELQGEELSFHVQVDIWEKEEAVDRLVGPNFKVINMYCSFIP